MSRSDRLKEKLGKSNWFSVDNYDEESAARTRPISFEEIMLRRSNKELLENVKDPAKEAWNTSPGGSSEKIADHVESERIDRDDKSSSFGTEKHALEEPVNVSSRKKVESTYVKKDDLTEGDDRANYILETKSSTALNDKGRVTKDKTGEEMHGWRKNERISDNSQYKAGNKHSRESVNKDCYAEISRSKSERNKKRKNQIGDDENPDKYHTERKHDKERHDRWKMKKRLSNNSEEVREKKYHRDSDKDKHAEGRAKYERDIRRKYRNGDDEAQDRNATRKQDLVKHHNPHIYERKEKREKVKSHYEESTAKRRQSRSREREDRRKSSSFSPRAQKHTYHDGEREESSMLSLKDSSRKKHTDVDRSRVSTNGSSSHHHRHGGSTSGLGGYSPRKRKSEAAVKTPSPSKHSLEKKRAGWDLPPVGTDNPSPAFVSSSFQLSNYTVLSNMHDVASATSLDLAMVKPLPVSFLNDVSAGKNANIGSVQLTQATRPMRRLYLENLPASASEKSVMDCFNNLLLSVGVNHIQQAQPCISCILHKDKGQALVEFLTAEDASTALSFDGSTLFGSIVKIRRPKDYVEVATGEPERSVDTAVTISDVVIDSPDKIFIGGISNHLSSEMLVDIAGAFGSLKAYHFETDDSNGSRAFLEYVDHSVTVKACAGLNGMKLGGEVLTVVQAMPNASSSLENGSKPPSYSIPEHAKPLLRKPTEVLEIKNVFALESILSLSDMAIGEILEDVRLECARFGSIKSINVVKHSSEKNLATKLEECEVINEVDSKEASPENPCVVNNAESSFSEKAASPVSKGISGVEFHYEKELEEDTVDDGSAADVDKNADEVVDNKSCHEEQLVSDRTVEAADKKSIPSSIIQECPDHQDTPNDGPELHEKMVANNIDVDIENKMVLFLLSMEELKHVFRQHIVYMDVSLMAEW
ncbi:splicing factor U2af large subunit B isoform X2 [Gastrolobium bilobum]|uniref:splicing factor U2af large subunit B isoform X2 n=1 Tax=Gastrolobium bilobum TaxID=150636 RepID=UPI002AB2C1BC|nr:splicing factor U2af large subunit B isoform X2 [Gastrolobium bilobum]